jgi:hypothetical protein
LIWDGYSIAKSGFANLLKIGASAYSGGYVGGTSGLLKSIAVAAGIKGATSYNDYTNDSVLYDNVSYSDYITFDNAIAVSVTGYIGYYAAASAAAAVSGVAAVSTVPVIAGAVALNAVSTVMSAHSAFVVAKLVVDTASPVIDPIKEMGNGALEYMLDFNLFSDDNSVSNGEL